MAKKIYPGNWVAQLSTYQNEPVLSQPGRLFYQPVGFAMVDGTGGTSFEVTIPSPDLRPGDKPLPNIMGLKLPAGAYVYHLGLRVPDMRKDRGKGTPFSGLIGTATDQLQLASSLGSTGIADGTMGTDPTAIVVGSKGTVDPSSTVAHDVPGAKQSGDVSLKVYVVAAGGGAGSNLRSDLIGGTPIIVEACYFLPDDAPTQDNTFVPYVTVAGNG